MHLFSYIYLKGRSVFLLYIAAFWSYLRLEERTSLLNTFPEFDERLEGAKIHGQVSIADG